MWSVIAISLFFAVTLTKGIRWVLFSTCRLNNFPVLPPHSRAPLVGVCVQLFSGYYQSGHRWPSLCRRLIWSCLPACVSWRGITGSLQMPPALSLAQNERLFFLSHTKAHFWPKSELFCSFFNLPELPHSLSLSRNQLQSSSHVQLPSEQQQHFTIRQPSAQRIRQHSRWGHGYVLLLTATGSNPLAERAFCKGSKSSSQTAACVPWLLFICLSCCYRVSVCVFLAAASRGNATGSSQTGDALGKALASVSQDSTINLSESGSPQMCIPDLTAFGF